MCAVSEAWLEGANPPTTPCFRTRIFPGGVAGVALFATLTLDNLSSSVKRGRPSFFAVLLPQGGPFHARLSRNLRPAGYSTGPAF